MTREPAAPLTDPATLKRLRRIAREAQNTYVGRHWPTMEAMRRDGIGHGLVEDRDHERFIRRFLDTFQPEFVVDLIEAAARAISTPAGLREAARAYLDAEAEPAYSWVIESQAARAEGRPNREQERMARIARARAALEEALQGADPTP